MRISTIQAFNNGVQGLQRNYASTIRTQEQISTGNRILTPADDPVASVRLLQLEQQQNVLSQYKENLTAADNSLVQEESVLSSINTVLLRVQELAVRSGSGTLSVEDRKSNAAELRERENELLGLMNTKNARGEYLFSGFQGKAEPFVRNADGTYSYQGDEGQRKLEIASSLNVAISDNGKKVFQNVTNAGRLDATSTLQAGSTLRASTPLVQDEVAFSGTPGFPDGGIDILFGNPNANSYEIFAAGTATPQLAVGSMDENEKTTDKLVFRGVVVNFDGVPAAGDRITITADPNRQKQGVLDSIANLRKVLEETPSTPEGSLIVRDAVAEAITNLSSASVVIDSTRGDIGARRNIIDTTLTSNEDSALGNKAVQAELRELDYPEALSRLSFQTLILEAAQQSYIKISGLNLFNKL
ncbi:flagellar hook-associated protein FlgL [Pseudomonas straminea]|uniref:Flagellar hook-associated protein 3 FlgL n=1 Tax=Pseudomonas straminea TaxID=47882 RepID=A0A1I1TKE7_PSEOC|nr:flagellar hook-associated protein FlgL [Pseudomonas straminea]GLX13027.1 flagellar hook-associated protein FlgL [Pseudomonas straminea]SFD57648.1 flagellar hook-associated protein 3 FlgL [Pseudomonas straminea]